MPPRIRKRFVKLAANPEVLVILIFEKVHPEADCELGDDFPWLSGHAWLRPCPSQLVLPVRRQRRGVVPGGRSVTHGQGVMFGVPHRHFQPMQKPIQGLGEQNVVPVQFQRTGKVLASRT
jgi:hypothetical protein